MGIFDKILSVMGGGLVESVANVIDKFHVSEEEKTALKIAIEDSRRQDLLAAAKIAHDADVEFNKRITEMEGTASDLKAIPGIGHLLIFLRGAQRPIWGLGTIYLDYMSFSGQWTLTEKQDSALITINLLVLGFLFGERAVRNVTPLIAGYFGRTAAPELTGNADADAKLFK